MANVTQISSDSYAHYCILIDADLLEEALLNRGGFAEDVEKLLKASHSPIINLYVTDRGLDRIRCNYDQATSDYFRSLFQGRIIPLSDSIQEKARRLNFADYESAIEHVCAEELNFDAIVTLNPSNFPESSIPIWMVSDLEHRILLERFDHLMNDRSTLGIVKARISPYCDGQIEWKGYIWGAINFEDEVFEESEFAWVSGVHQLTCIVKKLPRSLCPPYSFN